MSELELLRSRVAELENRIRELETQTREYHYHQYHAPTFIPFTHPSRIYIGDPVPLPWNTTSALPVTYYAGIHTQ